VSLTVNFYDAESAISARDVLNGREFLGREVGPVRLVYAQAPAPQGTGQDDSHSPAGFSSGFQNDRNGRDGSEERGLQQGNAPMTQENVSHIESYGGDLVRDLINKGSPNVNQGGASQFGDQMQGPPADVPAEGDVNEQQMLMTVLSQGDANLAADVQAVGSEFPK